MHLVLSELSAQNKNVVLKGTCPKCGVEVYGWGLSLPRHQTCATCGVGYIITENGKLVARGYSPFQAPEEGRIETRIKPKSLTQPDKAS
jgi:ribosomal protein S27AE